MENLPNHLPRPKVNLRIQAEQKPLNIEALKEKMCIGLLTRDIDPMAMTTESKFVPKRLKEFHKEALNVQSVHSSTMGNKLHKAKAGVTIASDRALIGGMPVPRKEHQKT